MQSMVIGRLSKQKSKNQVFSPPWFRPLPEKKEKRDKKRERTVRKAKQKRSSSKIKKAWSLYFSKTVLGFLAKAKVKS